MTHKTEALSPTELPALNIAGVSFTYGTKEVLSDISFAVPQGEVSFLLGPNGAGKTTLFSLITRLFDARVGRISIMGKDLRKIGAQALEPLGVVFQQSTLDLDLTVRQNLAYYGALRGMSAPDIRNRITRCLDDLDMDERSDEIVRTLNGGHRRRVEIARALLHKPRLLLLDEPTVGLDPNARRTIVARIHDLARSQRTSILWATHLVDEAEDNDRVFALVNGRLVAAGRVGEVIREHGATDLAAAFEHLVSAEAAS